VQLVGLLLEPNLALVHSIHSICYGDLLDEATSILVPFFEASNSHFALLFHAIRWEAMSCRNSATYLRRSSLGTKIAGIAFAEYGQEYIHTILGAFIEKILSQDASFEIDPTKVASEEALQQNIAAVEELARECFDLVVNSLEFVPFEIRLICLCVRAATKGHLPDDQIAAVSAIYFLRIITPALLSPQVNYGLAVEAPTPNQNRTLLFISKLIQAISNGTNLKDSQEKYMIPFAQFVSDRIPVARKFLDSISVLQEPMPSFIVMSFKKYHVDSLLPADLDVLIAEEDDEDECTSSSHISETFRQYKVQEFYFLHRFLASNQDRLYRAFLSMRHSSDGSIYMVAYDKLNNLLIRLGDPPTNAAKESRRRGGSVTATPALVGDKLSGFLIRNRPSPEAIASLESLGVFSQIGQTSLRQMVFLFSARKFIASSVDAELLLYHVFNLINPQFHESLTLVIYLTQFDQENDPGVKIIERFFSVLPGVTGASRTVILLNPSPYFLQIAPKINGILPRDSAKSIKIALSVDALHEMIVPVNLPRSTLSRLETTQTFTNAVVVHRKKKQPVTLKLGPFGFQLISTEKHKVFGIPIQSISVYSFSAISSITPAIDGDLLTVNIENKSSFTLSSADFATMSAAIKLAYQTFTLQSAPVVSENRVALRPDDVPGTLLNIALFNLTSEDQNLRTSAFSLIVSLLRAFEIEFSEPLFAVDCMSRNDRAFVLYVSEYLARSQPQFTLQFIDESILSLQSASILQKALCVEYISPWLSNLQLYAELPTEKMKHLIQVMIQMTITEQPLFHLVQSKIWMPLAECSFLIGTVIDNLVLTATNAKRGDVIAHIAADTMVSMAIK
jgi:neurofibromin 1